MGLVTREGCFGPSELDLNQDSGISKTDIPHGNCAGSQRWHMAFSLYLWPLPGYCRITEGIIIYVYSSTKYDRLFKCKKNHNKGFNQRMYCLLLWFQYLFQTIMLVIGLKFLTRAVSVWLFPSQWRTKYGWAHRNTGKIFCRLQNVSLACDIGLLL